jgi:hypothetical protein
MVNFVVSRSTVIATEPEFSSLFASSPSFVVKKFVVDVKTEPTWKKRIENLRFHTPKKIISLPRGEKNKVDRAKQETSLRSTPRQTTTTREGGNL